MISNYLSLSTKKGYNLALQHFKIVSSIIEKVDQYENLADVIVDLEIEGKISKEQILSIVNTLLVEKYQYTFKSYNMNSHIEKGEQIQKIVAQWSLFDIVIMYFHPQAGVNLINPKNMNHWESVGDICKNELINIYCIALNEDKIQLEKDVISDVIELLDGKIISEFQQYISDNSQSTQTVEQKVVSESLPTTEENVKNSESNQATTQSPPENKKIKITPRYSCQVTNELFHNGNVEAWKNIIESYHTIYKTAQVFVYHDGVRVKNLNSLFKWGKVKNGDVLLFAIAGEEFKSISKLQKYLIEGASPRFEKYLKKDINKPLKLF